MRAWVRVRTLPSSASYVGADTLPGMRRAMWALAFVLAAACSGEPVSSPTGAASTPPASASPTASPSASPSPGGGVEPVNVPTGTPASFDEDLDPSDVPAEALIPPGTTVTDVWTTE